MSTAPPSVLASESSSLQANQEAILSSFVAEANTQHQIAVHTRNRLQQVDRPLPATYVVKTLCNSVVYHFKKELSIQEAFLAEVSKANTPSQSANTRPPTVTSGAREPDNTCTDVSKSGASTLHKTATRDELDSVLRIFSQYEETLIDRNRGERRRTAIWNAEDVADQPEIVDEVARIHGEIEKLYEVAEITIDRATYGP
jgi:hypothetical protein